MTSSNYSSARYENAYIKARRQRAKRHPDNLLYFTEAYRTINGRPFEVPPAQQDVYADKHPFVVIRKPTQVGATEFNINMALWTADTQHADRGVALYLLPTMDMAERISQVRAGKAIQESTYLRRRAAQEAGSARGPANIRRRSVGSGIVYFCGADQETQYSGIDADTVLLDEYDLMREEVLSLAQSRLRSSKRPLLRVTSTPTIADAGVSYLYDLSDQRYYEMECPACGTWQEPQFPTSVDWDRLLVVCLFCAAALDPWRPGRWLARRPGVSEIRGYQLNRLVLPNPPLYEMKLVLDERVPTTTETFYRHDLGQPFSSPESRLTPEILDRCAQDWRPQAKLRTCVMGVDVGKLLHVVIRGRLAERWFLMEAFTVSDFEELEPYFRIYNVACCVVDARPETRAATAFKKLHHSVVWLADYLQQGIAPDWNWHDGVVKVSRTLIIDEMMHRFRSGQFVLPADYRSLHGGDYLRHLLSPARVVEMNNFGQPNAIYAGRKPDDFAHSEVYATLAASRAELNTGGVTFLDWDGNGRMYAIPHKSSDYDF